MTLQPIFERRGDNARRRTCMLMITHKCNLNCTYCYETHKDGQEMSFAMAKTILMKEFDFVERSDKFDEIEIDFMGGEPLMNFPLIKQVVEWIEGNTPRIPYICFMTSNGTLFSSEIKEWFEKHRDTIIPCISYDGTSDMQVVNRGAGAKNIDLGFFIKNWPNQGFHMTISKETLPNLVRGIIKLQRMGGALEAALAQGINWTKDDAVLFLEQLRLLANEYLSDNTLTPISLLTRQLFVNASTSEGQMKYCGTGTGMVTYENDGKSYGCHLFSPIVLGDKAVEIGEFNWDDESIGNDEECSTCVLKHYCPTCMGFNYRFRGSLAKRDKNACHMHLASLLAACEFQIKYLVQRGTLNTDDDAAHAKLALQTYQVLCGFNFPDSKAPFSINKERKGGDNNES